MMSMRLETNIMIMLMYFVQQNATNEQNWCYNREELNGIQELDICGLKELKLLPKK